VGEIMGEMPCEMPASGEAPDWVRVRTEVGEVRVSRCAG
jgi:hypothetical protein